MMQGIERAHFVGAILLGYHGGASELKGTLNHTLSSTTYMNITLNGNQVSEAVISAAIAGQFDVPIIMTTGDDGYIEHAKSVFQEVATVTTKWTTGYSSTQTLLPSQSCQLIYEQTKNALSNMNKCRPLHIKCPIDMKITLKNRAAAEILAYLKMIDRVDATTIQYIGEDMTDISMFLAFVSHTTRGMN